MFIKHPRLQILTPDGLRFSILVSNQECERCSWADLIRCWRGQRVADDN